MEEPKRSKFQRISATKASIETLLFSLANSGLGFLKSVIIAFFYGAGIQTDVFYAAQAFLYTPISLFSNCLNAIAIPSYQASSDKKKYSYSYLAAITIILLIIAVIASIFANPISALIYSGFSKSNKELLVKLIYYSIPVIVILPIGAFFDNIAKADKIQFYGNIGRLSNALVALILLFIFSQYGAMGMMWAAIAGTVTEVGILALFFFIRFRGPYDIDIRLGFKIFFKSLPVMIGGVLSIASLYFERFLCSFMLPGSLTIHGMGISIIGILRTVLVGSMIGVYYPYISELLVKRQYDEFYTLQAKLKKLVFGIMGFFLLFLCSISYPAFYLIYGHGKFDRESVALLAQQFCLLSFTVIYSGTGNINSFVYYSMFETRLQQIVNVFIALITGVLQWLLMQKMGIKALAVGASIALASSLFLDYAILKKKYHIVIYDNKDKITIILLLIFFLIPGFLKWNPVLLLLPIIYYVVICKLLYNLRISDFLSLSNLTRKQ
mgnify:FL=1